MKDLRTLSKEEVTALEAQYSVLEEAESVHARTTIECAIRELLGIGQ